MFSEQNRTALTRATNHANWLRHCEDVQSNISASFFWPTSVRSGSALLIQAKASYSALMLYQKFTSG